MNRIEEIRQRLESRDVVSVPEAGELTFSLSTSELAGTRRRVARRFVVARNGAPIASVRLLPKSWPFSVRDISATYERYSTLEGFKVPRLLDHFEGDDCDYFVEEHIPSVVSLGELVEKGEVSPEEAAAVVRRILLAIWESGETASADFVKEQAAMVRRQVTESLHSGALGEFLADFIEKSFTASQTPWRRVLSSGDIIDRNILRSGSSWYLVDFEYAHYTCFFFKEGYRASMYGAWARERPLPDLFPVSLDLPLEILELVSLAWEAHLCEELLEPLTLESERERLRGMLWDILDSRLGERLDTRLMLLDERRSHLETEVAELRSTVAQRDAEAAELRRRDAERLGLRAELELSKQSSAALQAELAETRELLDAGRDELSGLREALAASRDELRAKMKSLHVELEQKNQLVLARERLIDEIYRSRAWRITAPLRWLRERLRSS